MAKEYVLIVEDHKQQNIELCEIVREAGYTPLAAHDGYEALKLLRQHRRGLGFLSNKIRCILLDWNMPNMRGEEFLQILRYDERQKTFCMHIPVVIVSAYNDIEKRRLAGNQWHGMVADYITKPYNAEEVIDIVKRLVADKDNPSLVELYRKRGYRHYEELERIIEERETTKDRQRVAFAKGEKNEDALAYVAHWELELQTVLERMQSTPNLDAKLLADVEGLLGVVEQIKQGYV